MSNKSFLPQLLFFTYLSYKCCQITLKKQYLAVMCRVVQIKWRCCCFEYKFFSLKAIGLIFFCIRITARGDEVKFKKFI